MNCHATRRLLPLHAGSDLELSKATAVELHLSGCESCQRELDSYRAARHAMLAAREPGVTASGLWRSLEPRLAAADALRRLHRPWYRRALAPAALAAGLLLALTPLFLRGDSPGSAGTQSDAETSAAVATQVSESGLTPVPVEELQDWASRHGGLVRPRLRPEDPARVVAASHTGSRAKF